mmetsp:Transcript_10884/g.19220  ORF Transcript_10884/g.19220 Transcript_10884/m.19220 type:complete len:223 (+) Transcript_10884:303-971(+)
MDKADALSSSPDTSIRVSVALCFATTFSHYEVCNVAEFQVDSLLLLDLVHLCGDLVLDHTRGITELTEHEDSVIFLRVNYLLFEGLGPWALLGSAKGGTHVDPTCPQSQARGELLASGDSARGNPDCLAFLRSSCKENHTANISLTRVAGTLECVNGKDVYAHLFSSFGVANGNALVNTNATCFFEHGYPFLWVASRGLYNFDSALDNRLGVPFVVRGVHGG